MAVATLPGGFKAEDAILHAIGRLSKADLLALEQALTPKWSKYIPHKPTPKQAAFLLLNCRDAFYGGAAGGGKSDALLMCALQYVDIPGYRALLIRKTHADLALPGALMDRTRDWLAPWIDSGEIRWNDKEKSYIFPSGATLTFGYLEHEKDKYRYQGAEFQFIGVDEVTQLNERGFRYLFSRLRRLKGAPIPLRMRVASNPGGEGHEWVKLRYLIEGPEKGRIFIPAKLEDNPHLDMEEYEESLKELDPITRAQLRDGNWEVRTETSMFKREWFKVILPHQLPERLRRVRYWDLAATEVKRGKDPDWTVGLLLGEHKGFYYVLDLRRVRKIPSQVEALIARTADDDENSTNIWMEQEPGSAGVNVIDHYARMVLKGYAFRGNKETGSKTLRANPVASAAEQGRIYVVLASWNPEFFDELETFPGGAHDDIVDGLSGAFRMLKNRPSFDALPIEVGESESYWENIG